MAAGCLRLAAFGLFGQAEGPAEDERTGPKVFVVYSFWNTNSEIGSYFTKTLLRPIYSEGTIRTIVSRLRESSNFCYSTFYLKQKLQATKVTSIYTLDKSSC